MISAEQTLASMPSWFTGKMTRSCPSAGSCSWPFCIGRVPSTTKRRENHVEHQQCGAGVEPQPLDLAMQAASTGGPGLLPTGRIPRRRRGPSGRGLPAIGFGSPAVRSTTDAPGGTIYSTPAAAIRDTIPPTSCSYLFDHRRSDV